MPAKRTKKRKTFKFDVFGVSPILVLLLVLSSFTLLYSVSARVRKSQKANNKTMVLGSKDNNEEDKDEDKNKKEDEEKKKEEEIDSKEDREGKLEDEKETEKQEQERDKELEDKDQEEKKTEETVVNPDGTVSEISREVGGGEENVEIKVFDRYGNKIMEKKLKRDKEEGGARLEIKKFDKLGNKLSELKLETEDGKKLELKVKKGNSKVSRVKYDVEDQELLVQTPDKAGYQSGETEKGGKENENALKIKVKGNGFELERSGVSALAKFPIKVEEDTGKVFVATPVGNVELKSMPDTIVQKAKASGVDTVNNVELEEKENEVVYKVDGVKKENLVGIFKLNIPVNLLLDTQSGSVVKAEQNFFIKVLDLLSF